MAYNFYEMHGSETLQFVITLMKNQGSVRAGKAVDWLLSLFVDPGLQQDSVLIDSVEMHNRSKILQAFYNLQVNTTE